MKNIRKPVLLVLFAFLLVGMPLISQAAMVVDPFPSATSLDASFLPGLNPLAEINDQPNNFSFLSATVSRYLVGPGFDYYSFNIGPDFALKTNTQVVFDIDLAYSSGLDTYIELYDMYGAQITANDNSSFNGPGDFAPDTMNPFLSYTFDTAGQYYVGVSQNTNLAGIYLLHVSAVPLPSSIVLMVLGVVGFIGFKRKSIR